MYRFELVDWSGDPVAQTLSECVRFLHNWVRNNPGQKTFGFSLYLFDVDENEKTSFHEEEAKAFLFSVRDTVQLCGGKL